MNLGTSPEPLALQTAAYISQEEIKNPVLWSIEVLSYYFICGLTARVTCAGVDGGTPSERKKLRRRNCPKNAQSPQRQVHAVLGAFIRLLCLFQRVHPANLEEPLYDTWNSEKRNRQNQNQ